MELLFLKASRYTPEVKLNTRSKILSFKGRSSPENALQFYEQVFGALDKYFQAESQLRVKFMYEYFNTSSSKCIFEVFKKLQKYQAAGKKIKIFWVYEDGDDDMMETGEDFADIIGVNINFVGVANIEEIAA